MGRCPNFNKNREQEQIKESSSMDRKLEAAALSGDVAPLKETIADASNNSYSSLFLMRNLKGEEDVGNIFHLAAWKGRVELFREAKNLSLPAMVMQELFCQRELDGAFPGFNPLHVAAYKGHLEIVHLILEFYTTSTAPVEWRNLDRYRKPWLAQDSDGSTPLHRALERKPRGKGNDEDEKCALQIFSMDMELLSNKDDKQGNSPLFLAVKAGYNQLALKILNCTHSPSVSGKDRSTPLHFLPNCSEAEEVCRVLVNKHPKLIKATDRNGRTFLHQWAMDNMVQLFECIVKSDNIIAPESKSDILDLMSATDKDGENPFHVAAKWRKVEAARTLARVYKEEIRAKQMNMSLSSSEPEPEQVDHDHLVVPWLVRNNKGQTPMELALHLYEKACELYSPTFGDKFQGENERLFLAITKGSPDVAEQIWDTQLRYGWSTSYPRPRKIWDDAFNYSVKVAKWVAEIERLPSLISDKDEVVEILREASEAGREWIVEPMLMKHHSVLKEVPAVWEEACKKGHVLTILAFIKNCPHFREICLKEQNTPLHLIEFDGYEQYRTFLQNPVIGGLKNFKDSDGATPLHRAIINGNIMLTEALLTTDGVDRSIKNNDNKTAMDLLVKVCSPDKPEWDEMCKRNGIIPGLKTTYFQDKTNMLEVRNTLSVVAALLATITFTAGFTLPGGFNNDTGDALLADKAVFLIFILADTLGMCCSMLMLTCLIWSMVCDRNKSLLLIDRSVPVLLAALYSTILAFMTGVYIVIRHKCLWAAIVILVLCSIFTISSERRITYKLLNMLNFVINWKSRDVLPDVEQGVASTSRGGSRPSWISRIACFGGCICQRKSD